MEFPALLPMDLQYCEIATTEAVLFDLLVKKPADLIVFFEAACLDETWSDRHLDFMQRMITCLTEQAFQDKLSGEFCQRVAQAIQNHFFVLDSVIPRNITIMLSDGEIKVNSLLLSSTSEFFKEILVTQCREANQQVLFLEYASKKLFSPVNAFISTGIVPDLWKKEEGELIELLHQVLSWRVYRLGEECEHTLKKYLTRENSVDMLIRALQEQWTYFKKECIDFINENAVEFHLGSSSSDRLAFEFYSFTDSALSVFQKLQDWVTDLSCKKNVSENIIFSQIVRQCPRLLSLNLSTSPSLSEYLINIPKDLQAIDLSECSWLLQNTLKTVAAICPSIKTLTLDSNYQLNFAAWGELIKFNQLKSLSLSRCHQISDEDLLVILKAFAEGTELILDECRKIGDRGYFELARSLPRLTHLSLAHCAISDSALLEIASSCRSLTSFNLSHCDQLTEKGFRKLARQAFVLRELDVTQCRIMPSIVEEMRSRHPYLHINI